MERLYKLGMLMLLMATLFNACKKVHHEIDDAIVSINETTVSTVQQGTNLKVGFLLNKVSSFEVVLLQGTTVLLEETVTVEEGQKIINREFPIPIAEAWIGEVMLQVRYLSGGQEVVKQHALEITESNPEMFLVGGSTGAGWEPTLATAMHLYTDTSKTKFEIYEYLDAAGGGFKFLPTAVDWTNAFGAGAAAGSLLVDEDAGNIVPAESGFFRVRMDAQALSYSLLKLSFGVIGSATPGGWDNDVMMELVGAKGSYSWQTTLRLVPGVFKFRANGIWEVNLGGALNNLTFDGDDLPVETAGMYTVKLHLRPGAYTAELIPQ